MALVELDNVVKFYGAHQALGPLTLSLPDSSCGLLGPNGAGKSTLIRLLLGMIPPTSGTLKVLGEEVTPGNRALRGKVGYAPEGDSFFPDLTGVEAVTFAGQLVGMRKVDALQRAHQVLDYVELGEARYRQVETFSTGMRQRLKLAQALVHDPQLLILDEPTEGVDPEARLHLLDLIAELEQEHGIKLLLSTHLLHDVERLVPNALVLNEGRAVTHGTIADLKKTTSKSYLVRVNGPPTQLTEKLTQAGVRWELADPNVRVALENPRDILRHVRDAGLVVRHLAPVEQSLEEAFEQAVASRPAEAAPGEVA
jgi:ABC-2 type transport system ATP-binding protein